MSSENPSHAGSAPLPTSPSTETKIPDCVQQAKDMLQDLMQHEPEACRKLFKHKTVVEESNFLNTTPIKVRAMKKKDASDEKDRFSISPIGIINGLLEVMTENSGCRVAMLTNDETGDFIGFGIVDSRGAVIG